MKQPTFYFVIMLLLLNCSCSIKGSFQGLYSYYEKTKARNPQLLIKSNNNVCEERKTNEPKVYVVNGQTLSKCLSVYDHSIVYIWLPRCKSKRCYPLNLLQQKCDRKNIQLFIVAEYYDSELMDANYNIIHPIFGIDIEYYNTNVTSKYLSKFIHDLTSRDSVNGNFLYFIKGQLTKSFDEIESI